MFNKKNSNITKAKRAKLAELVPVSCHYDSKTLITKNSDLIQVIEVKGFEPNDEFFKTKELRDEVRNTILKNINSSEYAIYYHIIRNRFNLMPYSTTGNDVIDKVTNLWCKQNNWDKQLVNTLYITIVKQGIRFNGFNIANFLQSMFFMIIKSKYFKHFKKSAEELTDITTNIASDLKRFGANVLKIKEENGDYISEPLSFFHNIIHLRNKKIKVSMFDAAEYLTNIDIKYHFNTLEIATENHTRYAAVFNIKAPMETEAQFYNSLLQLGQNFILCESNIFTPKDIALKDFKKAEEIAVAAKNEEMPDITTLNDVLQSDQGESNDYCRRQITLIVYSDQKHFFDQKINKTVSKLKSIGLMAIREDFNLATAYFSCMPGNFYYNNRFNYTATKLSASFTSIHSNSIGCYNGSKWGPPVTLFRSLYGIPYYFNFHSHNNGNTVIIGPRGTGKTTLTHFLLAQAMKFQPKIIYIDIEKRAEKFIELMGGTTIKITPDQKSEIQINPINIANHNNKPELLGEWLLKTFSKSDDSRCRSKKYIDVFYELAQNISKTENIEEQYQQITLALNKLEDGKIKSIYQEIINSDYFMNLYSEDNLDIVKQHKILNIDISECLKNKEIINSFLALLVNNIPKVLTGEPTIIVINHAHNIFDAYTFESRVNEWLELLTNNNAIALLAKEKKDNLEQYASLKRCIKNFATQIYLSDKMADKEFRYTFNLNETEINYIKSYNKLKRRFLIKHNDDSLVVSMDLAHLKDALDVLG